MKILHRWTNACLWEGDAENIKEAVEKAVAAGVCLDGASLNRASLDGASLDGARLVGASIHHVMCLGPIGSRSAYLTIWFMADGTRRYSTGCQNHITEDRFLVRISETHEDNRHAADYRAAIDFASAWSERNPIEPPTTETEEN